MDVDLEANLSEGGRVQYNQCMDIAKPAVPNIASPVRFIKEVAAELKKVTWPTRAETIKLTAVVIVLSVIVGVFIGGLDAGLVKITSLLFKK